MSPSEISRRTVLRGAALGAAVLASGADKLLGESVQAPPNIVFILADDMGYADISCNGRPDLHTPNIDSLASRGMRFLQAYAELRGLFGHAHRSDYRSLSGPPRCWSRRTARRTRHRFASEPSHAAFATAQGRIWNHPRGQVASWLAAKVRPVAERL